MSSTNRGAVRKESDFYATPLKAFVPLLPYLPKDREIWECACGDGRLVGAMKEFGLEVTGTDLIHGDDFLAMPILHSCAVVTNPPFSLALEFCQKAAEFAAETFLLLRLNFLASRKRKEWFQKFEPSCLFVLSERPGFTENGKTDSCDYAWFYWGNRHRGIIHL